MVGFGRCGFSDNKGNFFLIISKTGLKCLVTDMTRLWPLEDLEHHVSWNGSVS